MEKTPKEAAQLEKWLNEEGYEKYSGCLTSTEDYAYFKAFRDKEDEEKVLYQISYRFWDLAYSVLGSGTGESIRRARISVLTSL